MYRLNSPAILKENNEIVLFENEKSPLYWANLTANEDVVVNQGGTNSGKTHAIMRVLFTIGIIRSKYIITVISNTVTKLKEDALRIAFEVADLKFIKPFIESYNATDRTFTLWNGTIIEFKSFENEEQAKGGKRHILYVSEATRITWAIFYQAYLRTSVRTFIDYNPTATFYIHEKVINCPLTPKINAETNQPETDEHGQPVMEREFNSVKVIRSWHIHNPYLTQKEHDKLERIADPEMKKVYGRGLTGRLRGTIYPSWDEVEDFPWTDGVIWYVDWGISDKPTADPTAAGRLAYKPKDSQYDLVADEIATGQGIDPKDLAGQMWAAGYKSGQPCYCDHNPAANLRELRLKGIAAFPADKGSGSVIAGILFLKRKKIAYTRRSVNIREETKKYKFQEIEGIITNLPVDEYNHHMDGIRYGGHTHYLLTGIE